MTTLQFSFPRVCASMPTILSDDAPVMNKGMAYLNRQLGRDRSLYQVLNDSQILISTYLLPKEGREEDLMRHLYSPQPWPGAYGRSLPELTDFYWAQMCAKVISSELFPGPHQNLRGKSWIVYSPNGEQDAAMIRSFVRPEVQHLLDDGTTSLEFHTGVDVDFETLMGSLLTDYHNPKYTGIFIRDISEMLNSKTVFLMEFLGHYFSSTPGMLSIVKEKASVSIRRRVPITPITVDWMIKNNRFPSTGMLLFSATTDRGVRALDIRDKSQVVSIVGTDAVETVNRHMTTPIELPWGPAPNIPFATS